MENVNSDKESLKKWLKTLKLKKLHVVFILLISIMIGLIYIYIKKPLYQSKATIIIDSSNNSSINSRTISTYTELLKNQTIILDIINNVNFDVDASILRKNIDITSTEMSDLINISLNYTNPQKAELLLNTLITVFGDRLKQIDSSNKIQIFGDIYTSNSPINMDYKTGILSSIVIGTVISILYISVITYLKDEKEG